MIDLTGRPYKLADGQPIRPLFADGQPHSLSQLASQVITGWRPIMKAVEFQSQLNPDQTLTVPASVMGDIPIGQTVRVLIFLADNDTDQEWERLTAEEFGRGYANTDAIYDQLSTG